MITTTEPEILVSVTGLHRYYGNHHAVRGIDLELRRGDVLGLLGPNGAGKSSTMNVIAGVLAPSAGTIAVAGVDLVENPRGAKASLGYLPERPPLYPELTVDEYLDYAARLRRVDVADARERAKARCGLADVGRRLIGNLSKGFQQRVGIAQAIVHEPRVVILDEPTVGLDPNQIRGIRALIVELGRTCGVIVSTHILPEVLTTCTRVMIVDRGRVAYSERLDALRAPLEQIFIETTMGDDAA